MENDFIPDYTQYSTEELLDIYMNLDKQLYPEKTRIIEEQLRKKMDSTLPAADKKTVIIRFLKKRKYWIAGVLGFILYYYLNKSSYSPEDQMTPAMYLYPALIHLIVLSILIFYANKGKIIAGVLIALYFAYMLFGRLIF
jgi:hypothetical protein